MRKKPLHHRLLHGLEVDFSEIPKIFDELVKKQEKEKKNRELTVDNVLKKLIELCKFFGTDDTSPDTLVEFANAFVDDETRKRALKK